MKKNVDMFHIHILTKSAILINCFDFMCKKIVRQKLKVNFLLYGENTETFV